MSVCKTIGVGVMPDVAWNGDKLHVVWGQTPCVWAMFTSEAS